MFEDVGILDQRMLWSKNFLIDFSQRADQPTAGLAFAPSDVGTIGEGAVQVGFGASLAVPNRDAVSPPKLAGNAPVAFFGKPIDIAFGVAFGMDFDTTRDHGVDRQLREAGSAVGVVPHADEPLVG